MPPKKTKFVNINAKGCEAPLLPGRQPCECQAVKHELVNNCVSCGRVICIQEGPGPCFFCGEIVMSKSERRRFLEGNPKEIQKLLSKYNKLPKPADEKKILADAQKEKLLEFDRNSVKRTQVIDDQADYFSTENPWLSEEEKKVMTQKQQDYIDAKNKLKKRYTVTIDFAGRKIVEEAPKASSLHDYNTMNTGKSKKGNDKIKSDTFENEQQFAKPEFVGKLNKQDQDTPVIWSDRIQDSALQEMVDFGNCLSVSQPYASLIIDGIKRFEGRNWYTPVRGRLWISAGGKSPTTEVLEAVKNAYKHIVDDIQYPTTIPTGCLLGCVDLIECLPQEECREVYPVCEVGDPFVCILANPQPLPIKMPIQGKPKIFKLDSHIHQAAKKALMNVK
ncbi:unnamed protein product [Orchesella dallaii]|uniref:ASCH domain-containing protein n=1 Tax=Orchesella dallaii TaxID=48710 RepID=A0ABP1RZV9_9HEXA